MTEEMKAFLEENYSPVKRGVSLRAKLMRKFRLSFAQADPIAKAFEEEAKTRQQEEEE